MAEGWHWLPSRNNEHIDAGHILSSCQPDRRSIALYLTMVQDGAKRNLSASRNSTPEPLDYRVLGPSCSSVSSEYWNS